MNPLIRDTNFEHNPSKELSLYSVICLPDVELHCHVARSSFSPAPHTVQHFKGHYGVLCYSFIRHKSTLRVRYYIGQNTFYPVCEDLRNDPRYNITQADGAEIHNIFWIIFF